VSREKVKKKRSVKKRTVPKRKPVSRKKTADLELPADEKGEVVCFNRDCKLRKKKTCKGFEGCPGFLGR
jgi:hypothetical protein